jgi:chromosomal replication initiation ATPase DnaA
MGSLQNPAVFIATQRAGLAQVIAAQVYGVPVEQLRSPTRGRPHVARARQIAIHLARCVFDMSHRELALEFRRDRSTVHHACHHIAALREESGEFDSTLNWMEALLRRAAGKP